MGRKDKEIKLIAVTHVLNAQRNAVEQEAHIHAVFAEKKSVVRSEFYQAAATGLKPKLTFVVWTREYESEQRLEYAGEKYNIIRTFELNGEETELVCEGIVNKAV